jgi:hypothetical protein
VRAFYPLEKIPQIGYIRCNGGASRNVRLNVGGDNVAFVESGG